MSFMYLSLIGIVAFWKSKQQILLEMPLYTRINWNEDGTLFKSIITHTKDKGNQHLVTVNIITWYLVGLNRIFMFGVEDILSPNDSHVGDYMLFVY